jgi:predicted dehydrogenase
MTNYWKILIIGAGQLGSRHLQGILKSTLLLDIEVIDLNSNSISIAKTRSEEIEYNKKNIIIKYFTTYEEINSSFDLCIIATTSTSRLKIIDYVTRKSKIKYFLLEKILFQKISEFEIAKNIILKYNIKTWVNCPRRIYQVYQDLKIFLKGDKINNIHVKGYDWGIACNGIHFLDLFSFFTDSALTFYSLNNFNETKESKRKGFYEILGSIVFMNDTGSKLILESNKDFVQDFIIEINTDNYKLFVNETIGKYKILDKQGKLHSESDFKLPFQSDLTNLICDHLFNNHFCNLPEYNLSMNSHILCIKAFNEIFSKNGIETNNGCPIT